MILVIRISGDVDLDEDVKETLYRLRLRRKYVAVILKPSAVNLKILKKMRNHVAYGSIDKGTLKELVDKRSIPVNKSKKIDTIKVIEELEKTQRAKEIKPFFRLHPPRGGIDSKKHFGVSKKAVLGDNREKINDLVRRML